MPKLTGIDAELAYQLSQKKETVKYYSKIVSLLWANTVVNCLLLVPCGIYIGMDIWDKGKLLFSKTKV